MSGAASTSNAAGLPESVPGVVDVVEVRGAASTAGALPDLVIEIPHGATRRAHFDALRAQLRGTAFPDDLIDFFFVNTDVGAPEAAIALADHVIRAEPVRSVRILRCLIPRTFIDCNRVIDESSQPTTQQKGGMTPGVVRYVTEPEDFALLFAKYSQYRATVTTTLEAVCNAGGTAVMLHSYAPRTVDVQVDEKIVQSLHAAYAPDVEKTWPLRAEVDLITKTPEGALLADAELVRLTREAFERAGLSVTESGTYPLHPSSLAHVFASKWPKQVLCLELRRDLLVEQFTPFNEMAADGAKCAKLAALLGNALLRWWASARR